MPEGTSGAMAPWTAHADPNRRFCREWNHACITTPTYRSVRAAGPGNLELTWVALATVQPLTAGDGELQATGNR